jgi:hypothetical protein
LMLWNHSPNSRMRSRMASVVRPETLIGEPSLRHL